MKKKWIVQAAAALMALCTVIWTAPLVHADTDGTELQVLQPSQLEIQLGAEWAGVEFRLKTDAGLYPDPIPVDESGILRLEIGGSETYILSCLDSAVAVPTPEPEAETAPPAADTNEEATDESSEEAPVFLEEYPEEEAKGAEIPVKYLVIFGVGLLIAVGALVALRVVQRRGNDDWEDDDDEDLPD